MSDHPPFLLLELQKPLRYTCNDSGNETPVSVEQVDSYRLGVFADFKDSEKNSPSREQAVRRIIRDLHSNNLIESLDCESRPHMPLHRRCLPGCGYNTPTTRVMRPVLGSSRAPCYQRDLC